MALESTQRKLDRVRPPRVHLTYDVEVGGGIEARELPFVIGVIGDFSGSNHPHSPIASRVFRQIDFDSFQLVMAETAPRVQIRIATSTSGEINLDLAFRSIEDFEPERLIEKIDILKQLRQGTDSASQTTLSGYLDSILHAPEFQAVESAWRGLWYLVCGTESGEQLHIKILDASKRELLRDLRTATEYDQSGLFKLVYEKPYGNAAGEAPFGLLIGNYMFGSGPGDIELLEGIAAVAGCAHAPFVAAAGLEMFGFEDFNRLAYARDLTRIFDSAEFAKWRQLRDSEDARYLVLTLPRILLRSPYGVRPGIPGDFAYEEDTAGGRSLLWGNAAFAFGVCVANAFTRYGWCGAIRGLEGGGLVEGLPTWFAEGQDAGNRRSSLEFIVNDRREKEIADAGFLPLLQHYRAEYAVFFSATSCARPRRYDSDAANANSRLSCQLQYVLTASRFLHYLEIMARDRKGSYVTRGDMERRLNTWISGYVSVDDYVSPAVRAARPLREAHVEVSEEATRPGIYRIVMFIRPYFQLDELSVSLRLIGSVGLR